VAIDLVDYLTTEGNSPRCWINFTAYAKKLLLKQDSNPWSTPAGYMDFYRQAHGLVRADVAVIDVWDMFRHWMQEDVEAIPSMAGKRRPTAALKTMLEMFGPRELLAEIITAMTSNYGASVPMALVMPSPRSLLARANRAANGIDTELDEMSVDTASMYVADYLRYFSETELSGVLLMEDPTLMPGSREELNWYQPVYNVANHYRWSVGLHLPFVGEGFALPDEVDFTIVSAEVAGPGTTAVDISNRVWGESDTETSPAPVNGFYYLSIPESSRPELVLEALAKLRS
jgi:hypothetical protein